MIANPRFSSMGYLTPYSILSACLLTAISCAAAEPVEDKPDMAAIKKLVEQLISPNQAPTLDEFGESKYPANYDHAAQGKVQAAVRKLNALGPAAFVELFAHFGDERYCITRAGSENDYNETVGTVCLNIFRYNIEPYSGYANSWPAQADVRSRGKVPPSRPSYMGHFKLTDPEAAAAWWAKQKDKPLRDIQIEILTWVFGVEEKNPETYSEQERTFIKQALEELKDAREPIRQEYHFTVK